MESSNSLMATMLEHPITFLDYPDLVLILDENETMFSLLNLNSEEILLKWANSILKRFDSSSFIPLTNFGSDLRDGQALSVLLHSINNKCPLPSFKTRESTANMVLQNAADVLGIKKEMIPPQLSMLEPKMGAMFVSQIFYLRHGDRSTMVSEPDMTAADSSLLIPSSNNANDINEFENETIDSYRTYDQTDCMDGDEIDLIDTRNETTLKNWINSQNFTNLHMDNLFDDDMVSLLQLIDHVEPGLVNWKKVFLPPVHNRFQKMDNAHYVVALCEKMGLKVINIAGLDLIDGQKKMILAIVSQLMRRHTFKGLADLAKHEGLTKVTDDHILEWANRRISSYDVNRRGVLHPSQSQYDIANYTTQPLLTLHDPRLRDGIFYLHLIDAVSVIANLDINESVDRQVIHYPDTKTTILPVTDKHHDTHEADENVINHMNEATALISYALTDTQRMSNTCLALNLAKQIGAKVYMTGEDMLRGGKKVNAAFLAAVWEAELRHLKNLEEKEGNCGDSEASVVPVPVDGVDNTTGNTTAALQGLHSVVPSNKVVRVIQTSSVRSIR